ncbi:hypothetical protein Q3304_08450 [Clostridioides sp. GD02377]|uniref:hypothetical protein n=1 Tax=unclassified Clostridioides TaxID=2635829 RepID=UPI0038A20D11
MFEVIFKLSISSLTTILFGLGIMYNKIFLDILQNSKIIANKKFQQKFGNKIRKLNKDIERIESLNSKSIRYKIYKYLKEIIENLDMEKDGVTPIGLVIFISSISFILTIVTAAFFEEANMILLLFIMFFYLILVIFRFMSLTQYEKREDDIMSAIDLLVPDIKKGVENSIRSYQNEFKPRIRKYFKSFLDDIDNKGFSFKEAMLVLEDKLGENFRDFASNSISYEEKADEVSDQEFSILIEIHSKKRETRDINKRAFNKTKFEIFSCIAMIGIYCVIAMYQDRFIMNFFLNMQIGKIAVLIHAIVMVFIVASLAKIKAKSL